MRRSQVASINLQKSPVFPFLWLSSSPLCKLCHIFSIHSSVDAASFLFLVLGTELTTWHLAGKHLGRGAKFQPGPVVFTGRPISCCTGSALLQGSCSLAHFGLRRKEDLAWLPMHRVVSTKLSLNEMCVSELELWDCDSFPEEPGITQEPLPGGLPSGRGAGSWLLPGGAWHGSLTERCPAWLTPFPEGGCVPRMVRPCRWEGNPWTPHCGDRPEA